MVKSVLLDNIIHKKLLDIQSIISQKKEYNINLGDIVSRLIDRDPEMVAKEVIDIIEKKQ